MIFVDARNPKPLYEQIKESIRTQVAHGVLRPDDRLPSVRELAHSAAINPNTIQRAYRDLEAEGLIYTVPGKGCFAAGLSEAARTKRREELLGLMRPLWEELAALGAGAEEIARRMKGESADDD